MVDTSVWSLFLRRPVPEPHRAVEVLKQLLEDDQALVAGLVYQELLSGLRSNKQFEELSEVLGGFTLVLADREDHRLAARYHGTCSRHGVQGSSFDLLLCAMAYRRGLPILTTDRDFDYYARHVPVRLLPYAEG
ncbi:MAG: PIN domain-containing protein [Verrucomicrobiae bacterium]|nr:PIN domain-containing protein [Verrucomicrobiae bacterium]